MKVTDALSSRGDGQPVVISDFTPPRSGDPAAVDRVRGLNVDFVCVAYNPGKLVRADSAAAAYAIRERVGTDVVFNLATRDMNRVALGTRLLGAAMLGLENVLILKGDPFTERERAQVRPVDDATPTGLIRDAAAMNQGTDYRGSALRGTTDLCIGAGLEPSRDPETEARLARRKVEAGAQFFVSQPLFDLVSRSRFLEAYEATAGGSLTTPVFWGLQVLDRDGIVLGDLPEGIKADLEKGRPGVEIAAEQLHAFLNAGIRGVYLVPPILRGGARDYEAAQRVLETIGR